MSAATVLFIERILQHKDLQGKLKRFFNTYFADIDTFAKKIPGFLQVKTKDIPETTHVLILGDRR